MAKFFGRKKKRILRSGYEDTIKADLDKRGIAYGYETIKLNYIKQSCPACGCQFSTGTYTPDFIIERHNWVRLVVECKGYFDVDDRSKMLRVKRDNPTEDIRLLFQRDNSIRKGSKTTYTQWSVKNGFIAEVGNAIPDAWIKDRSKVEQQEVKTKKKAVKT